MMNYHSFLYFIIIFLHNLIKNYISIFQLSQIFFFNFSSIKIFYTYILFILKMPSNALKNTKKMPSNALKCPQMPSNNK